MECRSQYKFSEYSAAWPSEFAAEAARLRVLLKEELVEQHERLAIEWYRQEPKSSVEGPV